MQLSKRTKGFVIALVAAAGIGAALGGQGGGGFLVKLALLLFLVWLAWSAFVLLWRFFRPVREIVMPATDKTLRSVGFGKIAEAGRRFNSQIDKAARQDPGNTENP